MWLRRPRANGLLALRAGLIGSSVEVLQAFVTLEALAEPFVMEYLYVRAIKIHC